METETEFKQALAAEHPNQTRIVVAQRISTVLRADHILVIDEGRLVAQGRHAELIRVSPVYREIYASQLGSGIAAEIGASGRAGEPGDSAARGRYPGRPRRHATDAAGAHRQDREGRRSARRAAPLAALLAPILGGVAWVLGCVVLYTGFGLVGPYLLGVAIDRLVRSKQAAGLAELALWMLSVYVVSNLLQAVAGRLMAGISQRALKQLRQDLFSRVQSLPVGFFDRNPAATCSAA